jgi:hypothetical protein
LFTNDLYGLPRGVARHAGLLSPQGKILFDFFIVRTAEGYLLDVAAAKAGELVKRLTMYKLRSDVAITDASQRYGVSAIWGEEGDLAGAIGEAMQFSDPRLAQLGLRLIAGDAAQPAANASPADYDALRVQLGVPEGGKDYDFGDAYPHEADFDLFNGVSFSKGCYVGQEVVARMQNKTVVRKRIVKVAGTAPLTPGADVLLGEAVVGRVGTADGHQALAMLRLDRTSEAEQNNLDLKAGGVDISVDANALARYRATAAARPPSALQS